MGSLVFYGGFIIAAIVITYGVITGKGNTATNNNFMNSFDANENQDILDPSTPNGAAYEAATGRLYGDHFHNF